MATPLLTESALLDALADGVRVVLPNRRSARTLRASYDARQQAAEKRAWDSAPAVAWDDWSRSLWTDLVSEGIESRLLLNSAQEHSLWREIIESSTTGRSLRSPDALADLAMSAWRVAATHLSIPRLRSSATTSDSRTFSKWAERFSRLLSSENCLSDAQIEDALREHIAAGHLHVDKPLLFVGFLEFTPAQLALLDALRSCGAGMQIAGLRAEREPDALRVWTVSNTPREEIQFAARWIRRFFSNHRTDDRTQRVAVLLPEPERDRAELESIFRELLSPELEPVSADLSSTPWEFTAGTRLATQSMIVDALDLLRWADGPLPLERVSALLLSPFWGSPEDRLTAARFDAHVLRRGPLLVPEIDLSTARRLTDQLRGRNSFKPILPWLKPFSDLVATRLHSPTNRDFAGWAEIFRGLLRAAGWPGARTATAFEFETARAWESTLDQIATLDFRGRRVPFAVALQTLERLVQHARVRVTASRAPIQIMQPEEADGSTFDAVLLLHANDGIWPESSHLHPLLGWPLQQTLELRGTDARRDLERVRQRAESLMECATQLVMSCATEGQDGRLRPSPLIPQLGLGSLPSEKIFDNAPESNLIAEEIVADDAPLPPLPSMTLGGGSRVLKAQAACGFFAFAEMRLRADSPDIREPGLDAGERGNLVHRALELFWTGTHSQEELRDLSREEREARLSEAVDATFAKIPLTTEAWSQAYLALQRERLFSLLNRWLDEELRRGPFTVLSREERQQVSVGPLLLSVRPDRIDEVEGGFALVDYKTGYGAEPSDWLGERPDDPQLPLYALLAQPGQLKALLFGRVRPGRQMKWTGLESTAGILPSTGARTTTDMDTRIEEWRTVLTNLAEDFASGRADVRPKSYATNCSRCEQRLLCRLDKASLEKVLLEDEQSEEDFGG